MSGKEYLPNIAYDSVIIGFSGEQLKVLIMEYHNTKLFALPGGFVRVDEDLDQAVRRGLNERTGLSNIYLEQFHTFGNMARFQPEVMRTILRANGHHDEEQYKWMTDRFISVAYYALIDYRCSLRLLYLVPDRFIAPAHPGPHIDCIQSYPNTAR